jgi:DNA-binding IclR family transcriptional regulator
VDAKHQATRNPSSGASPCCRPSGPGVVSELGREVGLSRSTTHRYVSTLATLGYLEQDGATKKYRLGPRVLDLGFSAIHSMELREISAPHLQKLSDDVGYTVNMAVLDGTDIVYVERCRSSWRGQRATPRLFWLRRPRRLAA